MSLRVIGKALQQTLCLRVRLTWQRQNITSVIKCHGQWKILGWVNVKECRWTVCDAHTHEHTHSDVPNNWQKHSTWWDRPICQHRFRLQGPCAQWQTIDTWQLKNPPEHWERVGMRYSIWNSVFNIQTTTYSSCTVPSGSMASKLVFFFFYAFCGFIFGGIFEMV